MKQSTINEVKKLEAEITKAVKDGHKGLALSLKDLLEGIFAEFISDTEDYIENYCK